MTCQNALDCKKYDFWMLGEFDDPQFAPRHCEPAGMCVAWLFGDFLKRFRAQEVYDSVGFMVSIGFIVHSKKSKNWIHLSYLSSFAHGIPFQNMGFICPCLDSSRSLGLSAGAKVRRLPDSERKKISRRLQPRATA